MLELVADRVDRIERMLVLLLKWRDSHDTRLEHSGLSQEEQEELRKFIGGKSWIDGHKQEKT